MEYYLNLLGFPVHCAPPKKRVVLYLLEASRSVGAFFVAGRNVAGNGHSFRFCFGALKDNEVACHGLISKCMLV